jgi:pSer/pThr/pTyr-binding forkhead associated (FHA) protein
MTVGTVTVGRAAQMADYLKDKGFVSRIHARLVLGKERMTVENLSRTNHTYVNDEPIQPGEMVLLKEGDEIGLGGCNNGGSRQDGAAYFKVVEGL